MSSATKDEICHVLADIGGTNARFAWVGQVDSHAENSYEEDAPLRCVVNYRCADFVRFEDALEAYLAHLRELHAPKPSSLCLAVAASVHNDLITLTNFNWHFSRRELVARLKFPVLVFNDFSAQAHCLSVVKDSDLQWLQIPATHTDGPRTIVGPGTGFGAATITVAGEVLESEPGHVSFAPVCLHEADLLRELWHRYARVSIEHLLSGPGLANLHWANGRLQQAPGGPSTPDAAAIVDMALHGNALALAAVQDFTAILGSVCGDIALSMGSLGGFYLSGGMLEKMGTLFDQDLFLSRFLAKGPFQSWCAQIPIARLTLSYPGLLGCAVLSRRGESERNL